MIFGCKTYIRLIINDYSCFEERVLEVNAESFEEAISLAEESSENYASTVGGVRVAYTQCYKAKEFSNEGNVKEVYSLLRKSKLSDDNFLDLYEDSGAEFGENNSRDYIDFNQFYELGLKALSRKQLFRIHLLRYNKLSYFEIAEIMFSSETLTRDTISAVSEALKNILRPLGI
jgi:hypothetical protein